MNKTILVILLITLVLGVTLAVVSLPTVSAISLDGGDGETSCSADPGTMHGDTLRDWKERCNQT
ncbi:hypothetical protein HYT23_05495 [Candidatus Pacearchaeota archaeon]|nr:hypothetical protein [Candidatus Pacearchaeota archaeon]